MSQRFKTQGVLRYSTLEADSSYKLTLIVDPTVAEFYRSLVPKSQKCQRGRYAPHVTVVRNEFPTNMKKWGAYENEEITIEYEPYIWYDGTYWWLDCYSRFLEKVRMELGLPKWSKWNMPPNKKRCFHMTIGNSK